MDCDEVDCFLEAYLDEELELSRQRDLEQHLNRCPACQALADESRQFRAFFSASAPVYPAPPELKTKILAAVRRQNPVNRLRFLRQPWTYAAAAMAVALCLGGAMLFPDPGKQTASQAVFDHSRALLVGPLLDVASADAQIVEPWFAIKLDFSPPVVDLLPSGYSLLGGRVEVIQNRRVAAIVYKRQKELVTLFVWPANPERLSKTDHSIQGYDVCTWNHRGLNYVAVSTLSDRELDEFTDLIREHLK